MAYTGAELRTEVRYDLLECGMLWRPGGPVPERIGPVMITNASMGGVQVRTKTTLGESDELLLQLGSNDGPIFIPGRVRYSISQNGDGSAHTYGFRFEAKSFRDREAIAKYVLLLRDRVCANV